MKITVVLFLIFLGACATASKFSKQCEGYGFEVGSTDHSICMKRESRELRGYLERLEAEDKAKSDSFYRDIERRRLGLDIK